MSLTLKYLSSRCHPSSYLLAVLAMFLANSLPILPGETSGKNNIAAYDELCVGF